MQNSTDGGENIVIWEFVEAGFRATNPCGKVHAMHLHCSPERHYVTRFIDGLTGKGPYRHGIVYPGTVRLNNERRGWKRAGYLECGSVVL